MGNKIKVRPIQTEQLFDFKVVKDKEQVPPGCIAVLEGYATLSDDRSNKNKHFYPKGFWDSVLNGNESIKEKMDAKAFFGSFKHPGQMDSPIPDYGNISHNIRNFKVDDKGVFVTLDVFDTEQGRELKPLLDYGSKLGISTRAYGEVEMDDQGFKVPVKDKYLFVTWDLVSLPAFNKTRMNKVSDSVEIEIDEDLIKSGSKEQFLDGVKKMNEHDAKMLCDYMGYDFSEIADAFKDNGSGSGSGSNTPEKTDPEQALDQALDLIKKLEDEISVLKANGGGDNQELQNQITILTDENTRLKGQVENNGNAVELQRLNNSVQFLKEKTKELRDENSQLSENNTMLKSIVSDKTATIEKLEGTIEQLSDAVEELKKSNKVLQRVNDTLEEKIEINTAKSKNDSENQPLTTVKKTKTGPMFRVHTGESRNPISDEASEIKEVFVKLKK